MHSPNKYTTPWPHVDVRAVAHLDVRLRNAHFKLRTLYVYDRTYDSLWNGTLER